MNLELMAMRWLRWERRCMIVLTERSPRTWGFGRPDVLGVTCGRHLVEIEVKRSVSDFRQDRLKPHRRFRLKEQAPRLFYYLVPPGLVDRVRPDLPPWAGLLSVDGYSLAVVFGSPVNRDAQQLSLKECVRLAYLVSNEAVSAWEAAERRREWSETEEPTMDYQI